VCDDDDAEPVAVGEDFDFGTSPDSFLAVRCSRCGLVYLNPWPARNELGRVHRPKRDFTQERGFEAAAWGTERTWAREIHRLRHSLPDTARVLHIGCGDGSELSLVRRFAAPNWRLEAVDSDVSAVEDLDLRADAYDAVILVNLLERVGDPLGVLRTVQRLLRPRGLALIATPNTGSTAYTVFQGRHWSGYDFPRHRNLFCAEALGQAAKMAGLEIVSIRTASASTTWVQSLRHAMTDWGAPRWTTAALERASGAALAAGAAIEWSQQLRGKGGLLLATLRRPAE
jgi:hypothetical protein